MSYPTAQRTTSVIDVDVAQDTDVNIIPAAVQAILDAEPRQYVYEASLQIYHTGLQTDGVTPSTADVGVIQTGDDPTLAMMRVTTMAVQDDPFVIVGEPLPTTLVFRTPTAGGARLRVQVTINYVGTAAPSVTG